MYRSFKIIFCVFLIGVLFQNADSQEVLNIQRISEEPKMDGNLFEPAWDKLPAYSLSQLNPNGGEAASERSEFKIAFSDQYLYFAAFNYDSEPEKVQSTSKSRDDMGLNNDWCGLMLDTYLDKENALSFSTTPAGLRLDMQIYNDGDGDFPVNQDWNAIWDVKTKTIEQGWFAEFQIPLSSLRYQVAEGKVVMAIGVFRYIARKSEWDIYPSISNEWGFWSWAKVSQFQKASMEGIRSVNPLYFSPYILAGAQQNFELNEHGDAYDGNSTFQRNAGIDVKYGLAKNLTLDLTLNTDFAQVEADDQEVNLTRYSLFFPEKRQFFMERSSIFDFQFGGEGRLFYSRTIGLHDEQVVPLWGGGRLTGRLGDWDIGVMSLQTGSLEEDGMRTLETKNHSIIRSRKKLALNKNSYAGFMITSLLDRNGEHDIGLGLDAILNLKGNTYLKVLLAQTHNNKQEEDFSFIDQNRLLVVLENRTFEGLSYVFHAGRSGKEYDPVMGFKFRSDFIKLGHHTNYGFIPKGSSWISRYSFGYGGDYHFRNEDMSVETANITPAFELTTKNSADFSIKFPIERDDLREEFEFTDDIVIEPGIYNNAGVNMSLSSSSEKKIYAEFGFKSGTYYGGWQNTFSVSPNISLGNTWNFYASYNYYRIIFSTLDELYQTHLMRLKATYMFSTKLSASLNVQYNTNNESYFVNAKIRFNPKEGNDLYIVFNDLINADRNSHVPMLPLSDQRTLLLKYTHTFRVR